MVCDIAFLKMTSRLDIQEQAQIAVRYEMLNFIVKVNCTLKDRYATLSPET